MKFSACFLFMVIGLWACSGSRSEEQNSGSNHQGITGYSINEPSQVYELPKELEEVSGMAAVSSTQLLLNEDENGKLYLFNLENSFVEKEIKWGDDGDYEGTALVGNTAYVVESKGTIFRITNWNSDNPEVEKFENESLDGCDVEGLHFLQEENVLLLACKEGLGREERRVHSFSLQTNTLQPEPYRIFDLNAVEDHLLITDLDKLSVELKKMLDPKGESGILFPSGIATHPTTKDLFVLSSQSKLLVVFSADGTLKEVFELTNELFRQPEAIAFTPNGDLYIGNEGNNGKPNILKFQYVKE